MEITLNEKIKMLEDLKKSCLEVEKCTAHIKSLFGSDYSGDFFTSYHGLLDFTIQNVAKLIGDNGEWLMWYIYDNNWGSSCFEAGYDNNLKKITTFEDLIWLIDLSKE